jgi:hypothetical protein
LHLSAQIPNTPATLKAPTVKLRFCYEAAPCGYGIQPRCLIEPGITGGERHDARLAKQRRGGEVEIAECLARWQPCLRKVPLDASAAALGNLQLSEYGAQSCRRPTLLVRGFGELRPEPRASGQTQLLQQ